MNVTRYCALLCLATLMSAAAFAEEPNPQPMVAPPPPRLIDEESGKTTVPGIPASNPEDADGTLSPAQRKHCQDLLGQLNGLPSGPQWSVGRSSVTTPDGRTYPTLERQADRKRLEEAYRQECTQRRR